MTAEAERWLTSVMALEKLSSSAGRSRSQSNSALPPCAFSKHGLPVFTEWARCCQARSISPPWWIAMWRSDDGWSSRSTADRRLLVKSVAVGDAAMPLVVVAEKRPDCTAPRISLNSDLSSHRSSEASCAAVLGPAASASAMPSSATAAVMRVEKEPRTRYFIR